jgi:hypothetical protein
LLSRETPTSPSSGLPQYLAMTAVLF